MRIAWGNIFFHTWQHIEGFLLVDNFESAEFSTGLFKSAIQSPEVYPLGVQAKLQSKEKFLLELQKEKHQMLLQTRELNKEKNAMANRIKDGQVFLSLDHD